MTQADKHAAEQEGREKVFEMIKDIKLAMMVTQDEEGHMFARPMVAQQRDENDQLWFFTAANSPKVREIEVNSNILLSYAESDGSAFVSISGEASIVTDANKIEELWDESLKAWFPEGKEDPNLCLIEVNPMSGEYWDQPSSKVVQAFGYLKARMTGDRERMGENRTVTL